MSVGMGPPNKGSHSNSSTNAGKGWLWAILSINAALSDIRQLIRIGQSIKARVVLNSGRNLQLIHKKASFYYFLLYVLVGARFISGDMAH